jgi:2'-5' RNA ligase
MRLFVAADISEAVRAELRRLRTIVDAALASARKPPRLTWVNPDVAHVTLRFLGEVAEDNAARLLHALGTRLPLPSFDVCWDRSGAFPGLRSPRILWIGATAGSDMLSNLARLINERVDPVMGPGESRPFTPHLTLARVREAGKGIDWRALLAQAQPAPTTMRVDKIVLYHSRVSPKGPTYTALQSTALM